jgi:hypothetical protein
VRGLFSMNQHHDVAVVDHDYHKNLVEIVCMLIKIRID